MNQEDRLKLHSPTVTETVRMTQALQRLITSAESEPSAMLQVKLVKAGLEDVDGLTDLAVMVGEELGVNVVAVLSNDQTYINIALITDLGIEE